MLATPMTPGHVALAVLAAVLWGATFVVTDAALKETPPILFAGLRFLGVIVFVPFVPRPKVGWPTLIAAGLLLGVGQYGLLFLGMDNGVPPGLASLVVHTQAFFTVAIAMMVFGERLTRRSVAALALGALGLAVLMSEKQSTDALLGLVFVVLAAVCGGSGNNILKSLGRVDMLGFVVWMGLAAPVPLFALSLVLETPRPLTLIAERATWITLGAVAYSAVLATIAGFTIWGRLLTTYRADQVAPFFLMVPIFGIGLSVAVTGETFSPLRAAGCALVFAGLVLATWRRRLREAGPG